MLAHIPHSDLQLQVCVANTHGLSIYDSRPNKAAFEAFSASPEIKRLMQAVGLPQPQITPIGEVRTAFVFGERLF
jgi:hypothetical protein